MSVRDRLSRLLQPEPRVAEPSPTLWPVERGTLAPATDGGSSRGSRAWPYERPRPQPPEGASNYVLLVLDSCRFDSLVAASPRHMTRLGPLERRYSYASWTSPAHFNLLMGLLPHPSPKNIYASDYYRQDFLRFRERLGFDGVNFLEMVPRLWLPSLLRHRVGYFTRALTSLPVLNPETPLAADFDQFELMPRHNDLFGMVQRLEFSEERPTFYLLNAGETHYPYAIPGEPEEEWPRVHGVNGVFKQLDASLRAGEGAQVGEATPLFDEAKMRILQSRQVEAARYVDAVVEALFDALPPNTYVTITADHGELFGEDGYFGHGPIVHDKVLEVPLIEGRLR